MTIKTVFIDYGGVIGRTEFQAPRQHLAERLGMEYEDLVKLVFASESSIQASLGTISEDEHWQVLMGRLRLPAQELDAVRDEFFAGDLVDRDLLAFLKGLRPKYKVGLISNAWSGLRGWLADREFDQAFDQMVISAEAGVMKPDARIYQLALEKMGAAAAESVFVDDFPENVEGARAVGMQAMLFKEPEKAKEELQQLLRAR
jgi:epoxide hydrolase-like predicted phosphatase